MSFSPCCDRHLSATSKPFDCESTIFGVGVKGHQGEAHLWGFQLPLTQTQVQVIYQSFHAGGRPMNTLSNLDAAVCVGQCNNDWGHLGFSGSTESSEKIGPYTGLAAPRLGRPWKEGGSLRT